MRPLRPTSFRRRSQYRSLQARPSLRSVHGEDAQRLHASCCETSAWPTRKLVTRGKMRGTRGSEQLDYGLIATRASEPSVHGDELPRCRQTPSARNASDPETVSGSMDAIGNADALERDPISLNCALGRGRKRVLCGLHVPAERGRGRRIATGVSIV